MFSTVLYSFMCPNTCCGIHWKYVYTHIIFLYKTVDDEQCTDDICGLGECIERSDGTFYECDCRDGAEAVGSSSSGTLTCTGNVVYTDHNSSGVALLLTLMGIWKLKKRIAY